MAISLPNGQQTLHSRLLTATPNELAEWLLARTPDSEAVRVEAPKADQRAIQVSVANLQRIDLINIAQNLGTPCLLVYGQNDPAIEAPAIWIRQAGWPS